MPNMDWPPLIAGAILGLITNLLTPSVQKTLKFLASRSTAGLTRLGERSLQARLKRLIEYHALVTEMRADPAKLIYRVTTDTLSLVVVMWLILVIGFFVFVRPDGAIHIPGAWWGGLGGALGASCRYFLSALASWTIAENVAYYQKFSDRNAAAQLFIQERLAKLKTAG